MFTKFEDVYHILDKEKYVDHIFFSEMYIIFYHNNSII